MNRRGFTLAEMLIASLILLVGIGAIFLVYPTLFRGVETTYQTIKAWGTCRQEIELLKNSPFDTVLLAMYSDVTVPKDATGDIAGPVAFVNTTGTRGVYYLERMYGKVGANTTDSVLDDLLKLDVVVCYKANNGVVGEDQNLNGSLDAGEDLNSNGKIDSVVSLTTLVVKGN